MNSGAPAADVIGDAAIAGGMSWLLRAVAHRPCPPMLMRRGQWSGQAVFSSPRVRDGALGPPCVSEPAMIAAPVNTPGLTELIALNVGLSVGIIDQGSSRFSF